MVTTQGWKTSLKPVHPMHHMAPYGYGIRFDAQHPQSFSIWTPVAGHFDSSVMKMVDQSRLV